MYIYTAGGGNPLYRAELLKQCSRGKNRAAEPIFFAELAFFVHKGDVEVKKGEQTLLEHLFLTVFYQFSPFVAQQMQPSEAFFDFLFPSYGCFRGGTCPMRQKVLPHPTMGHCLTVTALALSAHRPFGPARLARGLDNF